MSAPVPADYDTGSPVNLQYAQSTIAQQTNSSSWANLEGLTLTLPAANDYQDSALVTLCIPMSYATGTNFPGTNFGIAVNGEVIATGGFTYDVKTPVSSGRKPITLVCKVSLSESGPTTVQGQWSSVRGSTCVIDSFISISAVIAAPQQ